MNIFFIDDTRLWTVSDETLLEIAALLRAAADGAVDPVTGEQVEARRAEDLADAIEVGVESGSVSIGIDDRDRPAFRWAVADLNDGAAAGESLTALRRDLLGRE